MKLCFLKGANWMKKWKKVEGRRRARELSRKHSLFAYGVYYDNVLHVYLNMGLRLRDLHV